MDITKKPVVLRTACGGSRKIVVDKGLSEFSMPLLPYVKNAGISYYTQNIPEGTKYRLFRDNGLVEYGPFDLQMAVFEEVLDGQD